MVQGVSRHFDGRVDGGHVLSAPAVRVSLRYDTRVDGQRTFQGDGISAFETNHQSGDDRDVRVRYFAGSDAGRRRLERGMVVREVAVRFVVDGPARRHVEV